MTVSEEDVEAALEAALGAFWNAGGRIISGEARDRRSMRAALLAVSRLQPSGGGGGVESSLEPAKIQSMEGH